MTQKQQILEILMLNDLVDCRELRKVTHRFSEYLRQLRHDDGYKIDTIRGGGKCYYRLTLPGQGELKL